MWHFRRKARGEKIRDPIQGEFFATEAIANPAQALVRESVQNSLDAAIDKSNGIVRVRFFLATKEHAATPNSVAKYFANAWVHFGAKGNGLRTPPVESDSCPYLVVEDFGTKGLGGDPEQSDPIPGERNDFLLFFRAEGLSSKSERDRGRWGVGKFVFPRSSLASSHFGLTVRHDDGRTLLLGATTLKSHQVGDVTYCPDGLFGKPGAEDFVSPLEHDATINDFRSTFRISRQSEPGLSVVVPFLDPEISFKDILVSAAKDYFLPILSEELEILVESLKERVVLNAANLIETLRIHETSVGSDLAALVDLASWSTTVRVEDRVVLTDPHGTAAPKWSDAIVPADVAELISKRLSAGEAVAIRVPLTVHHKVNGSKSSHFDIYIRRDKQSDGRPCFAREGIIISDVRGRRVREFRTLVVVDDKPLATMLGDSENPAHTQWQKDSSHFRGNYKAGPSTLQFVINSVGELMSIVNRSELEADPSLTIDFFSVPPTEEDEPDETEGEVDKNKEGKDVVKPRPEIPARPSIIKVRRHTGGFSIVAGAEPPTPPFVIEVRCAYDIRVGNPLKRYRSADFDLAEKDFEVESKTTSTKVLRIDRNYMLAEVRETDFELTVSGFDPIRDIYVKAEVVEKSNDYQTN